MFGWVKHNRLSRIGAFGWSGESLRSFCWHGVHDGVVKCRLHRRASGVEKGFLESLPWFMEFLLLDFLRRDHESTQAHYLAALTTLPALMQLVQTVIFLTTPFLRARTL